MSGTGVTSGGLLSSGEADVRPPAAPIVTVVVTVTDEVVAPTEATLASLAAQTLSPSDFEVLVVRTSDLAAPGAASRVGDATLVPNLRNLTTRSGRPGDARNLALGAARGVWLTYVDGGDLVGPDFLRQMLEVAEPGVVVVAPVREATGASDVAAACGSAAVTPSAARHRSLTLAEDVAVCDHSNAKLFEVAVAAKSRFQPSWGRGEAPAFWAALFASSGFRLRKLADSPATSYFRVGDRRGDEFDREVTRRVECLGAVSSIEGSDPDVAAVVEQMRHRFGRGLNRYLRRRPDDRQRLLVEVERWGVHDVPWSSVNAGLSRQLAVCYCFPPDLDTSGMVAAKRLRAQGEPTDVISVDMGSARAHDPRALHVAGPALGRHHIVRGPMSFYSWPPVTHFVEQTLAQVKRWGTDAGGIPYDRLYSRAMAVSAHFAAAMVKLRHPELVWTAEFSDPLRFDTLNHERAAEIHDDAVARELLGALSDAGHVVPSSRRLFDVAERLVYAFADRVVFTNEHQRDVMLGYCEGDPALVERARERSEVWPHPVPAAELYDMARPELPLEPGRIHLAYFGVFYGTRDLSVLLEAMSRLDPRDRSRFALHVFTPKPHELVVQATRRGLADVVLARPYVGYFDYLALMRRFDVLLVNDAATSEHHTLNPYVPSKMADYAGSGTPVWVLYEPGSVLSRLPAAHRSALGDLEATHRVLRTLLDGTGRGDGQREGHVPMPR